MIRYFFALMFVAVTIFSFIESAWAARAWICAVSIKCTYLRVERGVTIGQLTEEVRGTGNSIYSEEEAMNFAKGDATSECASRPGGRSQGAWINPKCVEFTVPDNDNCR